MYVCMYVCISTIHNKNGIFFPGALLGGELFPVTPRTLFTGLPHHTIFEKGRWLRSKFITKNAGIAHSTAQEMSTAFCPLTLIVLHFSPIVVTLSVLLARCL